MARRFGSQIGLWAFPDCHPAGIRTGGAAVRECSRALPNMCIGALHAQCEAVNRKGRSVIRNTWVHQHPRQWSPFHWVETRGLVEGVEEAAQFDGRHVLQLCPALLWIRVDPFTWAAIAQ